MEFCLLILLSMLSYGTAVNMTCTGVNFRQFGSSCYEFILERQQGWHYADSDCRKKYGHLVDIHSFAENGFIFNTCQELGFHNDKGVWIGLTDADEEGTWHWVSNAGISFVNWAPGQPGIIGGLEDCVLMEYADQGAWHDYFCSGSNHGWICEYCCIDMQIRGQEIFALLFKTSVLLSSFI